MLPRFVTMDKSPADRESSSLNVVSSSIGWLGDELMILVGDASFSLGRIPQRSSFFFFEAFGISE